MFVAELNRTRRRSDCATWGTVLMRHSCVSEPEFHGDRSVVLRSLTILVVSVTVTSIASIAVLSFFERGRLHRELVENGHGLLRNLVENTWDSISMGQRATFQRVIDDFSRINGVEAVALYSRFGLMTYRSNEKTVGKPFVRSSEGLENPNLELYRQSRGRYRRKDWDLRDANETPKARRHIEKRRTEGRPCKECHFVVQESLRFDEQGRAHAIRDDLSEFYYRIRVEDECVLCHTNWEPGTTAGYLQVTLDNGFFNQEKRGNLIAMIDMVFAVLFPALAIMFSVFRGQAKLLERKVRERTAELDSAHQQALIANRRLRELDELKSGFLSSVSHELRTPLTSVIGFAKLTRKDFQKSFLPLADDDRKLAKKGKRIDANIGIIEEEGERLTRLINDVLDLAKIESGRMDWRDTTLSVGDLVTRATNAVQGQFMVRSDVALKASVAEDLPPVHLDKDRMTQVLINLLNNAGKFTREGEVEIAARRHGEREVEITVRDTGSGIPSDQLDKVFDKFQQVNRGDTLSDKPEGTGLGLPICKQIVEHYDGRIWAESASGEGSTFHVVLPAADAMAEDKGPVGDAEDQRADATEGGAAKRILVVDDDAHVREFLVQLLADNGYRTSAAADGRHAVEAVAAQRPDLITMDLLMPGMDGRTAIAALRRDPALRTIPIVVISVLSERERAGGDAALPKPVDEARLLETIDSLLEKREMGAGNCIVVRGKTGLPSRIPILPDRDAEVVEIGKLWQRLDEGYRGTIVVTHGALRDPELERLAGYRDVQVVIAPEGSEAEGGPE